MGSALFPLPLRGFLHVGQFLLVNLTILLHHSQNVDTAFSFCGDFKQKGCSSLFFEGVVGIGDSD